MNDSDLEQLKKAYRADGFAVIPGFLDQEEIHAMNSALNNFVLTRVPGMPTNHVVYEDKNNKETLKQMQDLHVYDPFFLDILVNSKFQRIAEALLDDEVIGKTVEYFNKPKRIGKATPPHQDGYYFMLKPPEALTMWLALEDADIENGCVRYVRGSHLKAMRSHASNDTTGFSQRIEDYGNEEDLLNEVVVPAKPGDLLVHHAMTIHRADGNSSATRSRKALGLIYFAKSAAEDHEAKAAYQELLAGRSGANT